MNILINSGRTASYLSTRRNLIISIIARGHNLVLTGYQKGLEKEIEDLGAKFIKVPLSRAGFNPVLDIILLIKYCKIIKKEEIDVVHSYTIKPNIYGSLAAKIMGVKKIFPTLNGIGFAFTGEGLKAKFTRIIASFLYFWAFKCSSKIFFHNTDDIKLIVKSNLTTKDKCILTYGSGIDMQYYKYQEMPKAFSFILISRLLKSKGIMEYLNAAKVVKEKYPNIVFNLIGPTDPNPTGIKINDIQYYLENDIIKYYNNQPDIRPFLKESSVVVLPSYREGLPNTILEGMSTGRAVITTDVPGCRETVINGKNGYLVKPFSSDDMAQKMCWMIENKEKLEEMGKASIELAKSKFEVNKVNQIIISSMNL